MKLSEKDKERFRFEWKNRFSQWDTKWNRPFHSKFFKKKGIPSEVFLFSCFHRNYRKITVASSFMSQCPTCGWTPLCVIVVRLQVSKSIWYLESSFLTAHAGLTKRATLERSVRGAVLIGCSKTMPMTGSKSGTQYGGQNAKKTCCQA